MTLETVWTHPPVSLSIPTFPTPGPAFLKRTPSDNSQGSDGNPRPGLYCPWEPVRPHLSCQSSSGSLARSSVSSLSTALSTEFNPQWPLSPTLRLLSKFWEWGPFWCRNRIGFRSSFQGTDICQAPYAMP